MEGLVAGVGLADDLAEGVVLEVVDDRGRVGARVVLSNVADGPLVIGEGPEDFVGAALGGEDLVDGRAV